MQLSSITQEPTWIYYTCDIQKPIKIILGLNIVCIVELQLEIIKLSLLSSWIDLEILWLTFDILLDCN